MRHAVKPTIHSAVQRTGDRRDGWENGDEGEKEISRSERERKGEKGMWELREYLAGDGARCRAQEPMIGLKKLYQVVFQ